MSQDGKRRRRRRKYRPRDPVVTSTIMRAVRSTQNRAEVLLRRELWSRGMRYRLYKRDLPGRPDIVFTSAKVAVFVDGDFWHGRVLREGGAKGLRYLIRGDRFDWWHDKLDGTVARDDRNTTLLEADGWTVVRVWESEVLK